LKSYVFLLFKIRIALKFYLVKLYLESFLFLRDFPGSPAPAAGGLYPPPGVCPQDDKDSLHHRQSGGTWRKSQKNFKKYLDNKDIS
jgi:hypothetical protein